MDRPEVQRSEVQAEWAYIMRRVEQEDAHPSDAQLRRLLTRGPPPEEALPYVASRIGSGPGRRTYREPYRWEWFGPFTQEQIDAVDDLAYLEDFLSGWDPHTGKALGWDPTETADPGDYRTRKLLIPVCSGPSVEMSFEFRWICSRKVWRMRSPMQQAIEVTAKRHHMSVAALHALWYDFVRFDFR